MKSDLSILRMSIEMTIIVVCLFSIVYLTSVDWKKNRWLVFIFLAHLWVAIGYTLSSNGYAIIPDNSLVLNPAPLIVFFPALYLYTQDLVQPNNILLTRRLLHFTPFPVMYILGVVLSWDAPIETFLRDENTFFTILFIVVNLILVLVYGYFILQLVRLNQHKYQDKFASSNPFLTLEWINWMVYFLIIIPFIGTFLNILFKTVLIEGEILVVGISMLIAMLVLAYFTFRQPLLYKEEQIEVLKQEEQKAIPSMLQKEKSVQTTNNFSISDDEKKAYITKIENYFEETKPYLNPKIRMPELARSLNIPRHIFSFIINEHYQMNFFNLINKYRIEYAKKLLKDNEHQFYTLETISQMSGFNSRSTFNKSFKALEGVSPKAFQKELE